MKRGLFIAASLLILALAFTSCGGTEKSEESEGEAVIPKDSQAAYNGFSTKLFAETLKSGEENPLISPASAYFCLAMTANGAEGKTQKAYDQVMGLPVDTLNTTCEALISGLQATGGDTKLTIADSIWINEQYTPEANFVKSVEKQYDAEVFKKKLTASKDAINDWVSQKTEGLIPELLTDAPSEDTVMLLINTLYLKAEWQQTFIKEATAEKNFTKGDGTQVSVPFLNDSDYACGYIKENAVEGVVLSYNDDALAFMALRPTDGKTAAEFAQGFDSTALTHYLSSAEDRNVILSLPKFEKDFSVTMKDALTEMGLSEAFDPAKVDFSKIGKDIYLSEVLQKTKIIVDEAGTEAAAATAAVMTMKGVMPEEKPTLSLDSPFVYVIVDKASGLPLFMGILDNPA